MEPLNLVLIALSVMLGAMGMAAGRVAYLERRRNDELAAEVERLRAELARRPAEEDPQEGEPG